MLIGRISLKALIKCLPARVVQVSTQNFAHLALLLSRGVPALAASLSPTTPLRWRVKDIQRGMEALGKVRGSRPLKELKVLHAEGKWEAIGF